MSNHHVLSTIRIVGPLTSVPEIAEQSLVWLRDWRVISDGEKNFYFFWLRPKPLPALSRSSA